MSNILRESARGQDCTVYAPGVQYHDPATVVLAHLNGAGMGAKHHDVLGCFACAECHAWIDYKYAKKYTRQDRDYYHFAAIIRTQQYWLKHGFIVEQKPDKLLSK